MTFCTQFPTDLMGSQASCSARQRDRGSDSELLIIGLGHVGRPVVVPGGGGGKHPGGNVLFKGRPVGWSHGSDLFLFFILAN